MGRPAVLDNAFQQRKTVLFQDPAGSGIVREGKCADGLYPAALVHLRQKQPDGLRRNSLLPTGRVKDAIAQHRVRRFLFIDTVAPNVSHVDPVRPDDEAIARRGGKQGLSVIVQGLLHAPGLLRKHSPNERLLGFFKIQPHRFFRAFVQCYKHAAFSMILFAVFKPAAGGTDSSLRSE